MGLRAGQLRDGVGRYASVRAGEGRETIKKQ
jgi:hypothetical protein